METPQNPVPAQSEVSELRSQCAQLQQLVSSMLLILIVVSGTLSVFLLRQWRFVKAELDSAQPAALQMLTEHTNNLAFTQDFLKKIAEYGRTHPEFNPITDKYHLKDFLAKPGSAPVTSSLPSSPGTNLPK
jgi:hypothetical protein